MSDTCARIDKSSSIIFLTRIFRIETSRLLSKKVYFFLPSLFFTFPRSFSLPPWSTWLEQIDRVIPLLSLDGGQQGRITEESSRMMQSSFNIFEPSPLKSWPRILTCLRWFPRELFAQPPPSWTVYPDNDHLDRLERGECLSNQFYANREKMTAKYILLVIRYAS